MVVETRVELLGNECFIVAEHHICAIGHPITWEIVARGQGAAIGALVIFPTTAQRTDIVFGAAIGGATQGARVCITNAAIYIRIPGSLFEETLWNSIGRVFEKWRFE